jgi:ADP-dependent NAD(P)H-hydrate dehydratase / NAD(P)H-hydrate epimerase
MGSMERWDDRVFMTRAQMREYDRLAIEELGVPGPVLMESAGRGAAGVALEMLGGEGIAVVLAGPGNNGGDGFVIARHLLNSGVRVETLLAVPRDKVAGDALLNLQILERMGAAPIALSGAEGLAVARERMRSADLVVDALLGTGVTRPVEGMLADLIELVNGAGAKVLAVDLPSGLDADTGRPQGVAVRAAATATFGHLKRGLVVHPGAQLAGEIAVVPLGVPASFSIRAGVDGALLSAESVRALVPKRPADAHKGTFGHLLLVAGSAGKAGAAVMAGRSALRAGTGLVTIAATAEARAAVEAQCVEAMVETSLVSPERALAEGDRRRLDALLDGKSAVAIGPGLSTATGARSAVMHLVSTLALPAVIDADGLNALAAAEGGVRPSGAPLVLTPHPGEMARLLGIPNADVQADRLGAARAAAARFGAVVILKGARSVVADADGRAFVNPTGNPGMASGGMGDALTGIVGGLLAQGLPALDAARLGVYLHGLAGDLAAEKTGEASLVCSDLIDALPRALRSLS